MSHMSVSKLLDLLSDELARLKAVLPKQYERSIERAKLSPEVAETIIARRAPYRAKLEEQRRKRADEQAARTARWREENALQREALEAGYRVLAKKYHPDVGGSHEQMVKLNALVKKPQRRSPEEIVEQWAAKQAAKGKR